jgi:phosphonate transport system substrate-binding protein
VNGSPRPAVRQGLSNRPAVRCASPDSAIPARSRPSPNPRTPMNPNLPISLFLVLSACGGSEGGAVAPDRTPEPAPSLLRMSFIPDNKVKALEAVADAIGAHLEQATGMKVVYEPSGNYQAAVNGLAANKLDLVWLGGVTSVQAEERTKGEAVFVACRDIDLQFKTYFIANRALIDAGKVPARLGSLAELGKLGKDLTFTFGARDSTSGHIMPRHFLKLSGVDPDRDFKGGAQYRETGGHGATFAGVAGGQIDLGALNFSTYDQQPAAERQKAPVIFTSPPYVDYCFVAHRRLGEAAIGRIRQALVSLDAADPRQKAVLEAWGCKQFVAADGRQWDGIRKVLAELPGDFLK